MPVALDTNFVLSVADEIDDPLDALDALHNRAIHLQLVISPTVIEEIVYFSKRGTTARLRAVATTALTRLSVWKIYAGHLTQVQKRIASEAADHLRNSGLLPMQERHDSLILSEAAVLNCLLLVTDDGQLRGIDFARLTFELRSFDLPAPVIASSKEIVQRFFR